ncbi:DNA cytosine methyltransferase [Actinomadura rudentiformis]
MARRISVIDLFCGVGGLSHGLMQAGLNVVAGFDIDPRCRYPFEKNIAAPFIEQDIRTVSKEQLEGLWKPGSIRLLAGCAPCQPFSPYRRGVDTTSEPQWSLLGEFARLAKESRPELVTMENVPRIMSSTIFREFASTLEEIGYGVSFKSCYGPEYGLPQERRRLVLIASRIGHINVPGGERKPGEFVTVRDAIYSLPVVHQGKTHDLDGMHKARALSPLNLKRIKASSPGGTWHDWPTELLSPCHARPSGATFRNVYARMEWDKPSPTITTMSYNFGTGRFGHPEQDRAITLREAAILQGFPKDYEFVRPGEPVEFNPIGRMIGNAVPPAIARAVGSALIAAVK